MYFSAADLVKKSAAQIKYLRDRKISIHTWKMQNGIEFQRQIAEKKENAANAGVSISAPTHQMVMKWLREEKDVLITYDLAGPFSSKLLVKVYKKDYDLDWIEATTIIRKTLKEAIDAAIQWSLENLI